MTPLTRALMLGGFCLALLVARLMFNHDDAASTALLFLFGMGCGAFLTHVTTARG